MGYQERRRKEKIRKYIFLGIIVGVIYWYFYAPLHKAPNIYKSSEWYVNDLYMSDQYYYENLLDEEEKEIYRQIFEEYNNMEEEFVVNKDYETVSKIWDALICDHPEMINITTFSYYDHGNSIKIKPKYLTKSKFSLNLKIRKMQRMIKKVVKETKGKSEFEKEKYIYEWLGSKSNYGQGLLNVDQSAYTAFTMMTNTVCAGYGKAAQILLNNCGLNSMVNINSNHIWNTVEIEGEYYFFDATVTGSTGENLSGNVSYMGLNQNINTSNYEILYPEILPEITGEKYIYYDYYGLTKTYTEDSLDEIKEILDNSSFKNVEIKFTNLREAYWGLKEEKEYLGISDIITYGDYCSGNGVIMLVKE